jgi:hypothetical protein
MSLIWGKLPDALNRLGILFEIVGVLSVVPDIVGEKRLEKVICEVRNYERTQQYIQEYLYSSTEVANQEAQPFLVALSLSGNIIMCFFMILLSANLTFSIRGDWTATALSIAFAFIGIEAVTWIVLALLFFMWRSLVYKLPNLFSYFIVTNSFISALGVLISSALAFFIKITIPLLIFAAKMPIRKTVAIVTLPFIFLGALLQFAATFF